MLELKESEKNSFKTVHSLSVKIGKSNLMILIVNTYYK